MDDFTWLRHASGGYFRCPVGAVDDWRTRGWEPSDPPPEPNPVTAEQPAPPAAAEPDSTKTSRKGGTADTTPQEG